MPNELNIVTVRFAAEPRSTFYLVEMQVDNIWSVGPVKLEEIGVRFTSFKLIDSFALLTVAFGTEFEIDLLGLSTLIALRPEAGKEVPPLAEVQLALKASFLSAQGFLGLAAQLTPASFILSCDCHLTGGYAFYPTFKESG